MHWMTTRRLDYPFAEVRLVVRRVRPQSAGRGIKDHEVSVSVRPIGEMTVHRESMKRVLSESPQSLRAILDATRAALQTDWAGVGENGELPGGEIQDESWEV